MADAYQPNSPWQPVNVEEVEAEIALALEEGRITRQRSLQELALLYSATGRHAEALACAEKFALLAKPSERARAYMAMGQLNEKIRDYGRAVDYYRAGLAMPADPMLSYWLNNNLGYSLVQIGECSQAISCLQAAVALEPQRPNAYKNLGLASVGLTEWAKAAEYFVQATEVDAGDGRSLRHLEALLRDHPTLLVELPGLAEKLLVCQRAVAEARKQGSRFAFHDFDLGAPKTKPWWAFWR